jgi:hypothetical protein
MLFLLWAVGVAGLAGGSALGGSPLPAVILGLGGLAVLLAIFAAWLRYGRQRLPFTTLLTAPFYILWKLPIYVRFLFRRQKAWVRTERGPLSPS